MQSYQSQSQSQSQSESVKNKHSFFVPTRDSQSEQQAVFLGLLNCKGYALTISRPRKESRITVPILPVSEISKNSLVYNITEMTNDRIKDLYDNSIKNGVTRKTAERRVRNFKIIEQLGVLLQIAHENNITSVKEKKTISKIYTNNNVESIGFDGFCLDKKAIGQAGREINDILLSYVKDNKTTKVEPGQTEIMSVILKYAEHIVFN